MSYRERNRKLREMLEDNTILIFPNKGLTLKDGMPNFGVIYTDLKDYVKQDEQDKKKKMNKKIILKPKTDTGLIKNENSDSDDDDNKKKGSTFDPSNFKNNIEVYKRMTEQELDLM